MFLSVGARLDQFLAGLDFHLVFADIEFGQFVPGLAIEIVDADVVP